MATVAMEKLLSTVIQLKASDIHISVGQPPVVRHQGRMRKLETKVLDPDDTTALMKSITPDRCQQELQQRGGADFAIEYVDGYRFRVAVFKQRGSIGIVLRRIPSAVSHLRTTPDARGDPLADRPPAGPAPRHRADGVRQDDVARVDDELHQRQLRPAHHHARRPDRVLSQAQEVHGQPARNRRRRARLQRRHPPGLADGPGRDSRRRNAGLGNDPRRHRSGRNGPRRVRYAAHLRGRVHDQPDHRRVPEGPARPGPNATFDRPHGSAVPSPACRRSRRA